MNARLRFLGRMLARIAYAVGFEETGDEITNEIANWYDD